MSSVKSQSKAFGNISRSGNFQAGEDILGELTFGRLRSFASLGIPSQILESKHAIPFKGVTHSVTKDGEVIAVAWLTEVTSSTDDLIAVRSPTIITLGNLESYTFSTYSKTFYKVEAYWDQEAQVWSASSDEVLGLATEAETLESLRQKVRIMVPELLELNGSLPEILPHMLVIDIISHRQELVEVM